jgi:hypothetical protein
VFVKEVPLKGAGTKPAPDAADVPSKEAVAEAV